VPARDKKAVDTWAPFALAEPDFERFRQLLAREAGIALAPHKRALVVARLSGRLRELRVASFRDYLKLVLADERELGQMLDRMSTNETRFFREPRHFALLEHQILPRWAREGAAGERPKRARIWSAACSTGEEAFSIAMTARHALPVEDGWHVEILATDLSTRALERAREATWPLERARDVPNAHRKRFLLRGVGSQLGRTRATRELRAMVAFHRVNLNDDSSAALGSFDVIFCCNVFIYFDPAARARAVDRLLARLKPDGYLFLGHAESLNGAAHGVRCVAPNVYVPSRGGAPR
jgi:chemotaxis protein methyltransferase CheR